MRTTLNIDDELVIAAKKRAAEQRTTLTNVIEQALRRSLAVGDGRTSPRITSVPVFSGGSGPAAGVTTEDLMSNARIEEILETPQETRQKLGFE